MIKFSFLLFTFLLSFFAAKAQKSWPDADRHKGLELLEHQGNLSVLVSENAKSDSISLHYLREAKNYFDSIFGLDFPVAVLFISNEAWNDHAYYPPPGMPQAWAGNIFLGSGKSVVALQAEQELQQLPSDELKRLSAHFGEPLDMDLFYRHNIAIHELGHLYHLYEATKSQRKWLQEVFATYAAQAYLLKFQPDLAAATRVYAEIGSELHFENIKHHSLEKFEELYLPGLGPQNYEWFQFQLFQKALRLNEKFGTEGLVKLRNILVATDMETHPELSDSEFYKLAETQLGREMAEILFEWNY